jgi:Fic/DOC family protein
MTVIDYVIEEVQRQGHDVLVLDGIERVGWMLEAWAFALHKSASKPELPDIVGLGRMVEKEKNRHGIRTGFVRVGTRFCPPPDQVPTLLEGLFAHRDEFSPVEFYKEFELIHPFRDGNGRTGKIVLNWLNGTLLDPVFPPANLFGKPIRNP